MVWTNTEAHASTEFLRAAPTTAGHVATGVGLAAAAAAVAACWLPIFQVGGFIYRIVEQHRGGAYTAAAAIAPVCLAVGVWLAGRLAPRAAPAARAAALAGLLVTTLAPVDHLTEALWRREHPERFGSPFDLRYGYLVGLLAVAGGLFVFLALLAELRGADGGEPMAQSGSRVPVAVAAAGLLIAVAGQVAESSAAHLWQLPLWPQVGRWWELVVTASIGGLAVLRRVGPAIAAGFAVASTSTVAAAERLSAYSALEDDPAVSSTITLIGFALLAAGLASSVADLARGSLRR